MSDIGANRNERFLALRLSGLDAGKGLSNSRCGMRPRIHMLHIYEINREVK